MIQWEENNTAYLEAKAYVENKELLFSNLKEHQGFDLILNCESYLPKIEELASLALHQLNERRCLVLILSPELTDHFPKEWVTVPTKTEALDFISFEQMQRDLAF